MKTLRRLSGENPGFPEVVLFHMGNVEKGAAFFDRFWPEARAVSDPAKLFYKAFTLGRGGIRQLLGPAVWSRGYKASLSGNSLGVPVGDPRQMPGAFLVRNDVVLWHHEYKHAGDHPDFSKVAEILARAS